MGGLDLLEKFILGAFGLIMIYLFIFNAKQTSEVIRAFAAGSSQVFTTLQGRGSGGGMLV